MKHQRFLGKIHAEFFDFYSLQRVNHRVDFIHSDLCAGKGKKQAGQNTGTATEFLNSFSRMQTFQLALINKEILNELEIVGSQKSKMKKVSQQYSLDVRALHFELNQQRQNIQDDPESTAAVKKVAFDNLDVQRKIRWNEIARKSIEKVEAELLPHQFERLNQLVLQNEMSQKFHARRFVSLKHLFDQLGIDKNQQIESGKELDAIQKEYEEKLGELREKYQRKLVERFPEQAKDKFTKTVGNMDDFEK